MGATKRSKFQANPSGTRDSLKMESSIWPELLLPRTGIMPLASSLA